MEKFRIGNWSYFITFVFYLFVSLWAALMTTGGWSGLGVIIFLGGAFVLLIFISLVMTIINVFKGVKYIDFNLYGLIPLFVTQLLFILGNKSDCGDSSGSYSFLSYMINGFSSPGCGSEYSDTLWFVLMALYIVGILFVYFFFSSSVSKEEKVSNQFPFWLTVVLWIIVIVFVISSTYVIFK